MAKTTNESKKGTKINLHELSVEELVKMEDDLRKDLFEMRFKIKVASLPNVRQIRQNKRSIARILTILKEKQLKEKQAVNG